MQSLGSNFSSAFGSQGIDSKNQSLDEEDNLQMKEMKKNVGSNLTKSFLKKNRVETSKLLKSENGEFYYIG